MIFFCKDSADFRHRKMALKIRISLYLTFNTKSSQIPRTFLWLFSQTFRLVYSPLNSATLSCSSEVTLLSVYSQSAHEISGKNARALVSTCTCILIFCRINLRCAIRTYFQTDRNFLLLLCRLGYPLLTSTILHTLGIYYITIPQKMAHFVLGLGFGIHFTLFYRFFSNVMYISRQYTIQSCMRGKLCTQIFFSMRCFRYLLGDAIQVK